MWWDVRIGSFWPKMDVFYTPEWTKCPHMKVSFEYFQIQKWMSQTVRVEKGDEKHGVILCSIFELRCVHLFKKCIKKSKYIKASYIYVSERSRCALSENGIVYYTMTYSFGNIWVWSWRILLKLRECRFENHPICLCSYESNTPKISHS